MKRDSKNLIQIVIGSFLTWLAIFAFMAQAGAPANAQRPKETRSNSDGSTTYIYADDRYGRDGARFEVTEKDGDRIVFRQWRDSQGLRLEEENTTYSGPKTELDPTGNEKTVVTRYFIYPRDGARRLTRETTTKTSITGTEYFSETREFDEQRVQIGGSRTEKDSQGRTKTYRWDPQRKDYVEATAGMSSRTFGERASTSAAKGFTVAGEVAGGLNTTTFETPRGKIYVNLPDDLSAGDTLSGTVVAQAEGKDEKTRTQNQGELAGYVVEIEKQQTSSTNRILSLSIPTSISTTYLLLKDKKGREVARCELPVAQQPQKSPPGQEFGLPTMGQQGRPVEVTGIFDGDFKTTNLTVGGEEMEILAESPRKLVARNNSNKAGPSQLVVREQSRMATGSFRSVGLKLSALKLDLLRGEQTTLIVTVLGLEGIKAPVPLVLENKSPSVITMGNGTIERISISPSQVQGGTYTTERPLTGIQRGAFSIIGTVTVNRQ
ncbi:MAG: hypothetical protein ND895_07675 [Pyrinomonadaceae bacterium]|nr:hypothetical protein [Pyrinomonadaceae bacterium]